MPLNIELQISIPQQLIEDLFGKCEIRHTHMARLFYLGPEEYGMHRLDAALLKNFSVLPLDVTDFA